MLNIPKVFTQSASKTLVHAQISAATMGFDKFGSAHLLIGLFKCNDELAQCMLADHAIAEVEATVSELMGRGETGFSRIMGMTAHAHRIMVRAVTYASPEKKTLAGTAHLWLELLHEEGCTAHKALAALHLSVEEMLTRLHNAVGEIARTEKALGIPASDEPLVVAVVHTKSEAPEHKEDAKDALQMYARNLTREAAANKLEPLIGRKQELHAIIRVLGKKTKHNPMLIGEPGVGKSALAEGLAQCIANGQAPQMLKDANIYALDLAQMIAGTKYRGEFEERVKRVIECAQKEEHAILFIDEMHTLIGAGSSEGSLDAANILKPALARGQLRVIGATTHKEYRKYVEKDPALARRFQRINVKEPDKDETLQILSGLRTRFEEYHHVTITEEALHSAADLSARYVTDRFMPDKAIDLLDEAASMAKLSAGEPAVIGRPEIARVVSEWTGIPLEHILTTQQENTLNLQTQLKSRIIGQDAAIDTLARSIRRAQAGLNDPNRPLGVFMLLGPSGVGKTALCKVLSASLFSPEDALIRVDMSEYSEEASMSRLIGSPPGYVGHGEGGQLTDAVLKKPYSVVLFDEIEKAHPKLFSLLLQMIDDGNLTDSQSRKVDFKHTIIVMTSNAGVSFDMNKQLGFSLGAGGAENDKRKREMLARVREVFRPEFLGRIDEIIVMNPLSEENGQKIAEMMLKETADRLKTRGITLTVDNAVYALLARLGMDAMSGARNLRRTIQEHIENPLSDLILSDYSVKHIAVLVQDGAFVLRCCDMHALMN